MTLIAKGYVDWEGNSAMEHGFIVFVVTTKKLWA